MAIFALKQVFDKRSKFMTIGFIVISVLSTIMILSGVFQVTKTPGLPVYRPGEEVKAFIFLEEIAQSGDVVVASYKTSNALPAWAPIRVIAGHGPESVRLDEFSGLIEDYYDGRMALEDEKNFFNQYSVDYVFWGPIEQQMGENDLFGNETLEAIYQEGPYIIFQVNRAEEPK